MSILQLLASDSFITFNKQIAKKYGLEEAVLLGALCSYQVSFGGEEFYKEQEVIMEDTTLTLYSLRKATKTLCDVGILEVSKKGLPAKNYYKVNEDKLCKCLSTRDIENNTTRDIENNSTSDSENNTTIKNNNSITNNSLTNKKESTKESLSAFSKDVADSIEKWLQYKREKRQAYKPIGLKTLLNKLENDVKENGEKYVIDAINHSIECNYSGIYSGSTYRMKDDEYCVDRPDRDYSKIFTSVDDIDEVEI